MHAISRMLQAPRQKSIRLCHSTSVSSSNNLRKLPCLIPAASVAIAVATTLLLAASFVDFAAAACNKSSFTDYTFKDSGGGDITNAGAMTGNSYSEYSTAMAERCCNTPGCVAFNIDGWLKNKLKPKDQWISIRRPVTAFRMWVLNTAVIPPSSPPPPPKSPPPPKPPPPPPPKPPAPPPPADAVAATAAAAAAANSSAAPPPPPPKSSSYEGQPGGDSSYTPQSSSYEGQPGDDSSYTPQSSSYEGQPGDDSSYTPQSSSYEGQPGDDSSYTPKSSSYEGQPGDDSSYTPQSSSYEGQPGDGEDLTALPQRQHFDQSQGGAQDSYPSVVREGYGDDGDGDDYRNRKLLEAGAGWTTQARVR